MQSPISKRTARHALETLGAMKLTKTRLKDREYLIRTDSTPEITQILEALHYQMPPRRLLQNGLRTAMLFLDNRIPRVNM